MYKVIVTGTDPSSRKGGIGFALPGYLAAMEHAGIAYISIPTYHPLASGGKWLLWMRAFPILRRHILEYRRTNNKVIVYSHAGAGISLFREGFILAFCRLLGAETIMQLHAFAVDTYLCHAWPRWLFRMAIYPSSAIAVLSLLAYQYSETVHAGVTLFSNYMAEHLSSDSTRGIIDLLTSGRSDRLESLLPTLANTFSPSFLVGGMPIAYRSIEIDPVDAFLRGGLLFLLLLLVAYWKIFFFSGGSGGKRYKLVLFLIWMGIAFTGGHLWMASTTAPMLVIALAYAGRMEPLGKKVYDQKKTQDSFV